MASKDFNALFVRPATALAAKDLAARDHRPVWLIIQDAVAYYAKVHKDPRVAPAPGTIPRRGRKAGDR